MRVLLSTIGTRGEVQPMLGLAVELRARGQDVRVCVPPDFVAWIEGLGFEVVPIGPELRQTAAPTATVPTPEQRRLMIEGTVATQFTTIQEAARGCDVVVGCGALQVAARSVTELLGIRYFHVHYCPITLPSPHHAALYADQWDGVWGPAINEHRVSLGLPPVADILGHIVTDQPWLAADPVLGPWPGGLDVVQTGAWFLPDDSVLPPVLERFLDAGEPPVYFGLGSMRAPGADIGQVMVQAARSIGRRAILSRGWADLPLADDGTDCIRIGDTNHAALFERVAVAVHHGGAGTTATVARARVPQVVVPQRYDQPYWAGRVAELGIGVALPQGMPTGVELAAALDQALGMETVARAMDIRMDGTAVAAERLITR